MASLLVRNGTFLTFMNKTVILPQNILFSDGAKIHSLVSRLF